MATKKKAKTTAPEAKKPVVRKDGKPTMAEKRVAKKAAVRVEKKAAQAKVIAIKIPIQEAVIAEKKLGRPPNPEFPWTDELGEQLFALFATGSTLREVADIPGNPSLYQLLKWLADKEHSFSRIHARAKEHLVPLFEDDARAITQKATRYAIVTKKQVVTKDGDVVPTTERRIVDNVERAKLAFAGLQWTLSHLQPKKHGRTPDNGDSGKNEQLEGLFAALKAGPVK